MFSDGIQMPSAKVVVSAAASAAATLMLLRSVTRDIVPPELQRYLYGKLKGFLCSFSTEFVLVIEEFDGLNKNQLFQAAKVYLQPTVSPQAVRFRASMSREEEKISLAMVTNQEFVDIFDGFQFKWRLIEQQVKPRLAHGPSHPYPMFTSKKRYFELRFHKKHREMVLSKYLKHVLDMSKELKEEKKTLKLFTLGPRAGRGGFRGMNPWQSVNLNHPSTFDTLAIDLEVKKAIIEDLDKFVSRKEYYRKVGKAWKRGYLLYGPPGTGKSSLVAAVANYLNFDIYDLELTAARSDQFLRKLLVATANRSILVVEDIDCSINLQDRAARAPVRNPHQFDQDGQVSLSGMLNFIDGLWSSCGDERIIIFTTNHKDRLDPALLRPGRMDMHIQMSYCTRDSFRSLVSNHLGVQNHTLFLEIEDLITKAKVTPAEVGEELMKNEVPDLALKDLIKFLENKQTTANKQ